MEKILFLLGTFCLISCSTEVYQSVSKYNYNKDGKTYFIGITQNNESVLLDSQLKKILPPYRSVGSICKNSIWVQKEKKWGLVNFKNRNIIPFEADYESGCGASEIYIYGINQKKGAANADGKKLIPFVYDEVYVDKNWERIIAHGNHKTDLYQFDGKPVSLGEFDYVGGLFKGISIVRKNEKLGAVDSNLNLICPLIYDHIGRFETEDNIAWVVLNKKIGYVDQNFKLIIPIEFDDGNIFANGMVSVKKDGQTIYLNKKGEKIHPTQAEIEAYQQKLNQIQESYNLIQFSS